jgi:hypothetical protein
MTTITWEVDGWLGGAVDGDGTDWCVYDSTGWFGPPGVRTSSEEKPTEDGEYSSRSLKTARVVTMVGYCKALTEALASQARDRVNALLGDGHLHRLTVTEPVEVRTAMVRLAGLDLTPHTARGFDFQVIVTAPDPRKYSAVLHSASTGLASPAPGGVLWNGPAGTTGVPWNGPAGSTGIHWQSGNGTSGVMALTNAWSAEAPIQFSISGPVTNPRLTNAVTQQVIQWDGTVQSGQTLTIDTGTHATKLGGQNRKSQLSRSEFFTIGPYQTVNVLFQADSGTGSLATAQWRDAAM